MHNFWAYVAALVFGPMIGFGIFYIFYVVFDTLFGGGSCLPTTCQ